jgi:dCMP deaminase
MHSTTSVTNKAIIAYVPALHAGYISFFKKYPDTPVFVLGKSFTNKFPRLDRDLRALDPKDIVTTLSVLGFSADVIEADSLEKILIYREYILPDEDISRDFKGQYLADRSSVLVSIFLRWDGVAANKTNPLRSDRTVSTRDLDQEFMRQALTESRQSPDWWRQIGAVLVIHDRPVAFGHTRYFPSDLALDIFGTPRITVDFGERPDLYISMHAEADTISQAACAGLSLKGASLYTSTFPCINCAFLIARSGISKLYYAEEYSNLNAEEVLKSAGVEIILVAGA